MKETEPALQSIMVNLLDCLHRNAPKEVVDSFKGN